MNLRRWWWSLWTARPRGIRAPRSEVEDVAARAHRVARRLEIQAALSARRAPRAFDAGDATQEERP